MELEGQQRVLSLPQLQSLMKKDPEAYGPEFEQQWSHFESMMEIFKLRPQKPHASFSEQVMFLAHVAPSFPVKGAALPGVLIGALSENFEIMHPSMRQVLVQALMLLRNRNQFPCIRTLPMYFKLFGLSDKALRKTIFTHIIRDIVQMNVKTRNQKMNTELRDFFFSHLKEGETEVARRACAAFVSLYRQDIWRDAHVVNLMSAGLLHPDVKIAAALSHLFLGNRTKGLEGILEESDEEGSDAEGAKEAVRDAVAHVKKTGRREKRAARAKKAVKKSSAKRRRSEGFTVGVSFVAIDILHDAQTLAERLLQRISKGGEPFLFRLLLLHLVARLVGRHRLQLPNLYAFLLKYISPKQNEVTKVLACLVEASHADVPPDELRPVVLHVMRAFVTEAQAPEVIEVGLNTIREVCARSINILEEDELGDLVEFRKFKRKGVSVAARSLINTYRELHPQLLHRSLRGREASMALSRGEIKAPQYGNNEAADSIEGLELLSKGPAAKAGGAAAGPVLTDEILSSDDFKRLRKLRLQRSIELQLGRKRKREEEALDSESGSSASGSDSDSEDEAAREERGLSGRLPGAVSAEELRGTPVRLRTKAARLAKAASGRTDYKEKMLEERKSRRGGKTNAEQKRNKPLMMVKRSDKVHQKKGKASMQKIRTMKKHIKTLRKTANHPKRRR
mmetsp:Transcript_74172/g.234265  ORF Transcript_74172/g.234265 Transcript_74172/m.234265 type:complete len:679 (-) Transcript_74172:107-2143(-)